MRHEEIQRKGYGETHKGQRRPKERSQAENQLTDRSRKARQCYHCNGMGKTGQGTGHEQWGLNSTTYQPTCVLRFKRHRQSQLSMTVCVHIHIYTMTICNPVNDSPNGSINLPNVQKNRIQIDWIDSFPNLTKHRLHPFLPYQTL